jgi:hypothetical protein
MRLDDEHLGAAELAYDRMLDIVPATDEGRTALVTYILMAEARRTRPNPEQRRRALELARDNLNALINSTDLIPFKLVEKLGALDPALATTIKRQIS